MFFHSTVIYTNICIYLQSLAKFVQRKEKLTASYNTKGYTTRTNGLFKAVSGTLSAPSSELKALVQIPSVLNFDETIFIRYSFCAFTYSFILNFTYFFSRSIVSPYLYVTTNGVRRLNQPTKNIHSNRIMFAHENTHYLDEVGDFISCTHVLRLKSALKLSTVII